MFIRKATLLFLSLSFFSYAGIENTLHNLSVTGPGNIKAVSETEICVFCHIPHHEQEGTPLWNRKMPTSVYTLYDSEFIQRINYPAPQQLSEFEGSPGIISRQCLSCHDGTVAIGAVYIVRGTELGNTVIQMQNVNPDGTLPSTLRTFIGTDLSVHHPVAVEYNPSIQVTFADGTVKTVELAATPSPPIKLYNYSGKDYVECTSCHDPHKQNKRFLRVDVGNLAQDFKQTCISCHNKPGWTGSAHDTQTLTYSDTNVTTVYGEGAPVSVADFGCGNCHTPHRSQGKPLLRKVEEATCFTGAASASNVAPCHGAGGAKDIESLLPPNKTYGHPVMDALYQNIHTPLDVLYGSGVPRVPTGSFGIEFSDSKHAECMDCHNPHKAKPGNHAATADTSGWYPQNPSNAVSNVLAGVYGVEPVWPQRWTQPSTYNTTAEAQKEYQICMKCHSGWALGAVTTDCVTTFTSSQSGIPLTDQSCEFNPYNRSAHPVVMTTNEMGTLSGWNQANGRYAQPLTNTQVLPPWDANVGNQTMYCTDCHGTDNEALGDPRGPHGSTHQFMLKGPNTNWPTKPDGTLYTTGDVKAGTTQGLFCTNCHDLTQAAVHMLTRPGAMYSIACVKCHIAVPHGSPVSRLLGYRTMPEPYNFNYNGTLQLMMDGFKWNTVLNNSDVYAPACGGGGRCHNWNAGGYDSYP
ncbi:MAG TPA: cytochrome C [Persephonella sp.]|uniref:Cytochrome c family protein n=1 Tax=Persephonella marina (strain DSM 14350 / EX-H1) TaxID=123214 RepID=C0QRC0_PERMH|nr:MULTISPECIES: cytochrome c3 family protein [Persephonella]ACO02993.1 cytochrome c family protein [Persephonella marina EX-H1]HCB68963.1 cytochrome C [Persephonella sp.]